MKVLDRHLTVSMLGPFIFTFIAFSSLMMIGNLFSSLDSFIQHKAPLAWILEYYRAFIPGMMTFVLPTTVLFSTLYSLLRLSRNAELTAMQACGVPMWRIYIPYMILALLCTLGFYYLTIVRGGNAKARQEAVTARIRGEMDSETIKRGQVYQDRTSGRVWYLRVLDLRLHQAEGVEVLVVNDQGEDDTKYFAKRAEWNNGYWTLYDIHAIHYSPTNAVLSEENIAVMPCMTWNENPLDMSVLQLKPDQLTFRQLRQINSRLNWQSDAVMAPYRTQLYYLWTYPLTILVLTLFALVDGTSHYRRNASAGVFNAIFILIFYYLVLYTFQAMGSGNRLPPLVATGGPILLFGIVAILRLAPKFGIYPLGIFGLR